MTAKNSTTWSKESHYITWRRTMRGERTRRHAGAVESGESGSSGRKKAQNESISRSRVHSAPAHWMKAAIAQLLHAIFQVNGLAVREGARLGARPSPERKTPARAPGRTRGARALPDRFDPV